MGYGMTMGRKLPLKICSDFEGKIFQGVCIVLILRNQLLFNAERLLMVSVL